jgi:hypothetical protein
MKSDRLKSSSPTQAMAAIYADHASTLDQYVAAFSPADEQVGAIFSIGGKVSGLDVFDYAQTFGKQMSKLVRSYALDAIDGATPESVGVGAGDATQFINDINRADASTFPAVGEGEDLRIRGNQISGGALLARKRLVHLCAFHIDAHTQAGESDGGSRMARSSLRRRHYSTP